MHLWAAEVYKKCILVTMSDQRVGGHILMVNLGADGTGWFNAPYEWVHHIEHGISEATGALGGTLGWIFSAAIGFLVGSAGAH